MTPRERALVEDKVLGQPMQMSYRTYLILKATMDGGTPLMMAVDAVDSTAIEHPEWPLNERRSWTEWEAAEKRR